MKCLILYILMAVHEVKCYSTETKCNVQNKMVDCRHLNMTIVPSNLPVYATSINLNRNSIQIVLGFTFQYFKNLTELDLSFNLIQSINKNAFHGLHSLQSLHLDHNVLQVLPIGMFDNLICLQHLWINNNKLKYNQDEEMKETSKILSLRSLHFEIYPDFKFPSKWSALSYLTHLEIISRSAKVKFNKEMFTHIKKLPITLLHLDKVPSISEDFFEHFPKLDSITLWLGDDLPTNPIDQVFRSFGVFKSRNMTNIEIGYSRFDNGFILNWNRLQYLWSICLKRLRLKDLYIKDISLNAMEEFSVQSTCLEYLEISKNILLDQGASFFTIVQNFENLKVLKINNNSHHSRSKRSQASILFSLILPQTLEELYMEDNIAGDLVDIKFMNGHNLRVLSFKNCEIWSCEGSFAGVIKVEYFDMSGWSCEKLSIDLLSGFPNLKTLNAIRSHLGIGFANIAGAGSFLSKNLKLQDINLSSNKMNSIPDGLFLHPFEQLSSVNMSNNNLTIFPKFHANIKTLTQIDLTFNSITQFNTEDIAQIEKLGAVDIILRGNPFQCSCKTLQFLKWLSETNRVQDILHLTCVTEKASRRFISEVISNLKTFEISCKTKFWLPFAVSLTSIIIFAMMLTVVFFRYKYAVEYFLLKFKMKMRNNTELTQEYIYDAFISYSHTDSEWIKQFHDNISSMGFELCLDAKNFIGGKGIAENVLNAIDSSRKVIFVITHNFLKSDWGSYEMEMTRMHAFQKGREDMVIVVVKDNIKITDMPDVMKTMWFKITCIQWPNDDNLPYNTEETFYEKMKMSLQRREDTTLLYSRNSVV